MMVRAMKTLYVKDRKQWRSWLAKNGKRAREIWLIYPKKHSGKVRIPYDDAVEEALCFGWIDGMTGKLDAERYVQRFTPRRPTSRWSPINIRRARKLIAAGKMTTAGRWRSGRSGGLRLIPRSYPRGWRRLLEAGPWLGITFSASLPSTSAWRSRG